MTKIQFRLNYEVKQKRKFEEFLMKFQRDIEYDLQELKIERYWKIEEQFQAEFFIEIGFVEKEKVIFETLAIANKLSTTWTINGPNENMTPYFECIFNNTKEKQPLKWAHLEINEYTKS